MNDKSLVPELPTKILDWIQQTLPSNQSIQCVELLKGGVLAELGSMPIEDPLGLI